MLYTAMFVFGVLVGAVCMFVIFMEMRSRLKQERKELAAEGRTLRARFEEASSRLREKADTEERKLRASNEEADSRLRLLNEQAVELRARQDEFAQRKITYDELRGENTMLKRDLQNIDVELRKLQLDRHLQQEEQATLNVRSRELGSRYLKENVKWISSSVNSTNFAASKQRLLTVVERCRSIGFDVSADEESELLGDLKAEFEKAVRAALEREEQARIKAQIREEQQLEREVERELKQLERERAAIQAALEKALADAEDEHSEEVERLKARLAEAEARTQRTISQAQLTKSGHVYVISNIGSFGESVFKIGVTRRLEPQDRIRELGDASVPFPFDIHMMISSDDAPKLENELHRAFHQLRVNRVNPRKEFFRVDIEAIRKVVEQNHGQVGYVVDPEAFQYRQSLEMSEEDSTYIDSVYEKVSDETGISVDDE